MRTTPRLDGDVFLYAFDLIELNGDDLRRDPLEVRKATPASVLTKAGPGIRFNEHIEGDGPSVFAHACKLGLEGIVSKRKDSAYRSGRSPDWLKMKNAEAPGVKREVCFSDPATADAFRNRFGGECLTHAPRRMHQP